MIIPEKIDKMVRLIQIQYTFSNNIRGQIDVGETKTPAMPTEADVKAIQTVQLLFTFFTP